MGCRTIAFFRTSLWACPYLQVTYPKRWLFLWALRIVFYIALLLIFESCLHFYWNTSRSVVSLIVKVHREGSCPWTGLAVYLQLTRYCPILNFWTFIRIPCLFSFIPELSKNYPSLESRLSSQVFQEPSQHTSEVIKSFILWSTSQSKIFHFLHEFFVLFLNFGRGGWILLKIGFGLFIGQVKFLVIELIESLVEVDVVKLFFFHDVRL